MAAIPEAGSMSFHTPVTASQEIQIGISETGKSAEFLQK
jgi:hypothetical protein